MEKELLDEVRLNREAYGKKILESIKESMYQCERYDMSFSIALGATCSDKVDMKEFENYTRETDKAIIFDKHFVCIIFNFVDADKGIKAASNLLSKFEMQFFSQKVYLGVVNINECERCEEQINKLFDIVKYSISNGMNNIPLNEVSF